MKEVWALFHWLAMSHTCYNPIILCWMNTKFRSGFCSLAYTLPCLRRWVDSWFFTQDEADLLKATTTLACHHYPRTASSRLVTISLKDDTIIFKSRNMNGKKDLPASYTCRKFLQMLEETSSESPLWGLENGCVLRRHEQRHIETHLLNLTLPRGVVETHL